MLLKLLILLAICNFSWESPVCPQNNCHPIQNYEPKAQPQLPSCPLNHFYSNGFCYHNSNLEQVPVIESVPLCSGSNCFQNSQVNIQPISSAPCQLHAQSSSAPCGQNSPTSVAPCQGNTQLCSSTPCSQPTPTCESPPCQRSPQPCQTPCEQNPQLSNVPCQQCPKSSAVTPCSQPYPYPQPPTPILPVIPTIPSTTTTTSTSTTTIRPIITTATQPPPAPLITCPDNTILLNGKCRVVYCGTGIYRNGKCVQTVCPEGTFWTGYKCEAPESIAHDVSLNRTTINNYSFRAPDITVHNSETVNVNASLNLPINISTPPQSPLEQSCCEVRTPRICEGNESKNNWNCYSKAERVCGDFCTTPVINLQPPPRVQYREPYLVMPPTPKYARRPFSTFSKSPYDCSSCLHRFPYGCPPFCYKYDCKKPRCSFLDQRSFCNQHPGQFGCVQQDGCFDDWCSNGYN